jgi:cellulose biosynthesis protein BcsQ
MQAEDKKTTDQFPEPLSIPSVQSSSLVPSRSGGQIIAVVSPKGGTGKTVFAATMAVVLRKMGKTAVAIDADFSTRGLSLYLMGDSVDSEGLHVNPENCIAEMVTSKLSADDMVPRRIVIAKTTIDIFLSNRNLWRGGVPDEKLVMRIASRARNDNNISAERYFRALRELFDRLRNNYEFIIVDTRGGYDFTSAIPAVLADGYVIVMEPDKVSIDQVKGFQESINSFASRYKFVAKIIGIVVNKATYPPDDDTVVRGLSRLCGGAPLGTIPADLSCIAAYQVKGLPLEQYPDSDYAYYAVAALDHIFAPKLNWEPQAQKTWTHFQAQLARAWKSRKRYDALRAWSPCVTLVLAGFAALLYLVGAISAGFDIGSLEVTWSLLVTWAVGSSWLSIQQLLRDRRAARSTRLWVFVIGLILLTSYVAVAIGELEFLRYGVPWLRGHAKMS